MIDVRACELCQTDGGEVLHRTATARIVLVAETAYPGFCRVIANRHAAEMTDLLPEERDGVMGAVYAVESALRDLLLPHKINLASLGNTVPHVHWHVVPRYEDDRHFPNPIWGSSRREADPRPLPPDFAARLRERLKVSLPD